MSEVISLINLKGGVGKTVSSINIAYSFAEFEKKVLIVDADSQGNIATSLGMIADELDNTLCDLIDEAIADGVTEQRVVECIRQVGKVDIIPANSVLAEMDYKVMNALAESIKANGLMEPIIVRKLEEGTYEILAGHRRTRATQLNGETEIKAIVIKADDELANRIMISTNFQQRDSYLPSEIAKSYLIRYTDLKNRKKIKDENSNGWNSEDKIDRIMEREFSTSKSKVYMYLRVNHLVQELLDVLDGRRLSLKIAVELSYLTEEEQKLVNDLVYQQRLYKLDLKKAVKIKQESAKKTIDESEMHKLLSDNPKSITVDGITFSSAEIGKYKSKFKDETHMKNSIIEFLKNY